MPAIACSNSASTARSTPSASPASVNTDRLCEGSEEWSSSLTPGSARIAAAMPSTISGRRPSLTFGTHSISIKASILALYFHRSPCYDPVAVTPMSDPLRTDGARAHADVTSASDRDAKIEQLLLVGLDHYFASRYELAINVWTRALFLDRSHARARA